MRGLILPVTSQSQRKVRLFAWPRLGLACTLCCPAREKTDTTAAAMIPYGITLRLSGSQSSWRDRVSRRVGEAMVHAWSWALCSVVESIMRRFTARSGFKIYSMSWDAVQ